MKAPNVRQYLQKWPGGRTTIRAYDAADGHLVPVFRRGEVGGFNFCRMRPHDKQPNPDANVRIGPLVADHAAVKIVGVGALDLHGRDFADPQRPMARDMDDAVDLRRVGFAAALGGP